MSTQNPQDNGRVPVIQEQIKQLQQGLDETRRAVEAAEAQRRHDHQEVMCKLGDVSVRQAVSEERFVTVFKRLDEQEEEIKTVDSSRKLEGRIEAIIASVIAVVSLVKG